MEESEIEETEHEAKADDAETSVKYSLLLNDPQELTGLWILLHGISEADANATEEKLERLAGKRDKRDGPICFVVPDDDVESFAFAYSNRIASSWEGEPDTD